MRTTEDDEDETEISTATETARPAWMTNLKSNAEAWLKVLPGSLDTPIISNSPLSRFFARECSIGSRLLSRIKKDLYELVEVCNGSVKQTNELRALMSDLNRGEPPPVPLSSWRMTNFLRRGTQPLAQIQDLERRRGRLVHHRSRFSYRPTPERRSVDRLLRRHLARWAISTRSIHHCDQTSCRPQEWMVS